jgi:4-hydroxybenzoyl-CoA thioesterase/acyl-CoA thioester hydrolase
VDSGSVRLTTKRRVEFVETDAAGIVHFSAFFVYMEQAEHQLLRHLGLGVFLRDEHGDISWPRVSASCDFRGPARFEDEISIEVAVERVGEKSVTYSHRLTCDGRDIANGRMTAVCCRVHHGGPPEPIPIPPQIAAILRGGENAARTGNVPGSGAAEPLM